MVEEKSNAGKENVSSQNDASVPQINVPDANDKTVDNPKVSSEENLMTVVYPPFFPIGNTQAMLTIKEVNLVPGENVGNASPADEHKATKNEEVDHQTAKTDESSKTDGIANSREALTKEMTPSPKNIGNPIVSLDLKV